jgi:hypothetical protein
MSAFQLINKPIDIPSDKSKPYGNDSGVVNFCVFHILDVLSNTQIYDYFWQCQAFIKNIFNFFFSLAIFRKFDPMEPIELYIKFRFRSATGQIQTVGQGIGTQMFFSNLEVKGTITEIRRGLSTVFQTYGGNVAYAPSTQARGFSFTINSYSPQTTFKLDYLNDAIRQGFRIEFWILEGYLVYDGSLGLLVEDSAQAIFSHAVVEYGDGRAKHREIKRGYGLVHATETPLTIWEGVHLSIPALPSAGDQEIDVISGTA